MRTRSARAAAIATLLWALAARAATPPLVTAGGETLQGSLDERYPAIASYKGIPFAAPPVGALRWQAPRPHRPRPGIQPAQAFAAGCYQDDYNSAWYRRVGHAFGADETVFADPPFSEDCLYLNVWTPAASAGDALPVMVWIHGGSNKAGWSFEPNYRAAALAARGRVVVVTVAYRLGVFGFFGHPSLRGTAAPANFGLLDQIAALRWVRREARAFGGDPANVTIFGESAGAADIGYLVASPAARGLFRRAISQSGGYMMGARDGVASVEQVGRMLAAALPGHPSLAALRRLPSEVVFRTARERLAGHDWGPVIDGRIVTRPVAAAYRRGGLAVDLLVGSNDNESYMYVDGDPASLERELAALPAAVRGALRARAARESTVHLGHDKVSGLVSMGCPPYLMAASAAARGHQAWVYRFTRVRPGPGGREFLAYHGAEVPYVFDTHDAWLSRDALDDSLTEAMLAYWSNFARSGNPNGAGLGRWPAFAGTAPEVMELGDRIGPMAAPDYALCLQVAEAVYPGWRR